jgi:hypothetical protein
MSGVMVNVHLCRNARNYLDKYRRRKLRVVRGDDAVMFADYLKIIIGGSKFFFSYKFINEGRLWNIFLD